MSILQELGLFHDQNYKLFINNKWITAEDNATFPIINPSTKKVIAQIPKLGKKEAAQAIDAAEAAFDGWRNLSAKERGTYLEKLHDLIIEQAEPLAKIMSLEMGKVYNEAKGEVFYAASFIEWFQEEGKRIYGESIPSPKSDKRLFVSKQPIGVVAAITPWNFPLGMLTRKVAPALAAGCTCVIKPASQTSLTAIAFAKLVEEAGFPAGVINIIAGSTKEISDTIFASPAVKKVSFTGSTEVGKALVAQSADQLKKLSLELGGHAPFIIFKDADIEKAAEGVIASKFRNSGQTCVCTNRIYVDETVKERFTQCLMDKMKALKTGNSLDESVNIGPLVNQAGLDKVKQQVTDAVEKGAKVLVGGDESELKEGYFFEPTLLDGVTDDMNITQEETFGPVAPLYTFTDEAEAIQKANDSPYGLAAYFYTHDINRAIKVSEALDYGIIGMNDALPSTAEAPFGGIKESGYGKEGGHQGIAEYLIEKYISFQF